MLRRDDLILSKPYPAFWRLGWVQRRQVILLLALIGPSLALGAGEWLAGNFSSLILHALVAQIAILLAACWGAISGALIAAREVGNGGYELVLLSGQPAGVMVRSYLRAALRRLWWPSVLPVGLLPLLLLGNLAISLKLQAALTAFWLNFPYDTMPPYPDLAGPTVRYALLGVAWCWLPPAAVMYGLAMGFRRGARTVAVMAPFGVVGVAGVIWLTYAILFGMVGLDGIGSGALLAVFLLWRRGVEVAGHALWRVK